MVTSYFNKGKGQIHVREFINGKYNHVGWCNTIEEAENLANEYTLRPFRAVMDDDYVEVAKSPTWWKLASQQSINRILNNTSGIRYKY